MDGLSLLVVALASYRLSFALAVEEGPFGIFLAIRDRAGQASWLGRGLHCVLCISFWLSLLLLWVWGLGDYYINALIRGIAVAGAVLVMYRGILGSYEP